MPGGFCDIAVPYSDSEEERVKIVAAAIDMGYDAIAWERVCERVILPEHRADTMETVDVRALGRAIALRGGAGAARKFRQFKRLTMVVDNQSQLHRIATTNDNVSGYDIVAVRPADERLFSICCTSPDVEVISLDLTRRIPFMVKLATALQATRRGCFFELRCSPLVGGSDAERRETLANAMQIVRSSKGTGIILSGGTSDPFLMRAPRCIANLGVLVGLDPAASISGVGRYPLRAAARGYAVRETHRGATVLVPASEGAEAARFVRGSGATRGRGGRGGDGAAGDGSGSSGDDDDSDDDVDDDDDDDTNNADGKDGAGTAAGKKRKSVADLIAAGKAKRAKVGDKGDSKGAAEGKRKAGLTLGPGEDFIKL